MSSITCYSLVSIHSLQVGSTLPSSSNPDAPAIVTHPRRIALFNFADAHHSNELTDIVCGTLIPPLRLAVLQPNGDIAVNDTSQVSCHNGWTVTGIEPYERVFGPQGARVVEVVTRGRRDFGRHANRAIVWPYERELRKLRRSNARMRAARAAAMNALHAVGADGLFWHDIGTGVSGWEIIALVARDLIGSTPGWTVEAYLLLTTPWRVAYNDHVHPHDSIMLLGALA